MPNFNEILTKKPDEVAKPKLPPEGTYRFGVIKLPSVTEVGDGKFDMVNYPVRAQEAGPDIDPDALAEFGELHSIVLGASFLFNKEDVNEFVKTENAHKRFLQEHLGVWADDMGMSEAMNASVNAQFTGVVKWSEDKRNPGEFQARITKTMPID